MKRKRHAVLSAPSDEKWPTPEEIVALLARAKVARDALQAATERINPTIERAERVFLKLHAGVSTSIPFGDNGRRFVFDGVRGQMFIANDLKSQPLPLRTTSRSTRLQALKLLPALHEALEVAGQ